MRCLLTEAVTAPAIAGAHRQASHAFEQPQLSQMAHRTFHAPTVQEEPLPEEEEEEPPPAEEEEEVVEEEVSCCTEALCRGYGRLAVCGHLPCQGWAAAQLPEQ